MAARAAHIALAQQMKTTGNMLYGIAILDEAQNMIGTAIICEFEAEEELDAWLKIEPYVTGKVWEKIEADPKHIEFMEKLRAKKKEYLAKNRL